jgi:hypothetical protein
VGETDAEGSETANVVQRAMAAGSGAAIGALIGGPAGAIAGSAAGVALEPLVSRVWNELSADGRRRTQEVLAYAAVAAGTSPEEVADQIVVGEKSRLLGGTALSAATRTAYPPKVRALALALASGLANDQARIDDEQLVIAAIADLEAPHVSLLELLVRCMPDFREDGIASAPAVLSDSGEGWRPGSRVWKVRWIAEARPTLAPVLTALLGTLQRHGLAAQQDDIARALEAYGKELEKKSKRNSQRITWDNRSTSSISTPPAYRLRELVPEASWVPTQFGEVVLDYLVAASD